MAAGQASLAEQALQQLKEHQPPERAAPVRPRADPSKEQVVTYPSSASAESRGRAVEDAGSVVSAIAAGLEKAAHHTEGVVLALRENEATREVVDWVAAPGYAVWEIAGFNLADPTVVLAALLIGWFAWSRWSASPTSRSRALLGSLLQIRSTPLPACGFPISHYCGNGCGCAA